ncbi:hypothetical protein FF38_11098 [Lucilia cuprina]|uniref:Uncharacterized protein n=1 Tax=Lucilia cuprina TaxID=7375 RepID=A0A0L0C873_LUCCU|nr:hypothetical protein FF38_11098 [Lucilia cuprina]
MRMMRSVSPDIYAKQVTANTAIRLAATKAWKHNTYGHAKILEQICMKLQLDYVIPEPVFDTGFAISIPDRMSYTNGQYIMRWIKNTRRKCVYYVESSPRMPVVSRGDSVIFIGYPCVATWHGDIEGNNRADVLAKDGSALLVTEFGCNIGISYVKGKQLIADKLHTIANRTVKIQYQEPNCGKRTLASGHSCAEAKTSFIQ